MCVCTEGDHCVAHLVDISPYSVTMQLWPPHDSPLSQLMIICVSKDNIPVNKSFHNILLSTVVGWVDRKNGNKANYDEVTINFFIPLLCVIVVVVLCCVVLDCGKCWFRFNCMSIPTTYE